MSGHAPLSPGALPGTAPYVPAPEGGSQPGRLEPPPQAPRSARWAFGISMVAAFAVPVWYLCVASMFPDTSSRDVLGASAVVGAVMVLLAFTLSVRAVVAGSGGAGHALALASVGVSCIAVVTNFFGWLLGAAATNAF